MFLIVFQLILRAISPSYGSASKLFVRLLACGLQADLQPFRDAAEANVLKNPQVVSPSTDIEDDYCNYHTFRRR